MPRLPQHGVPLMSAMITLMLMMIGCTLHCSVCPRPHVRVVGLLGKIIIGFGGVALPIEVVNEMSRGS